MALRTILEFPDPRLRTRAEPVTRFDATLGTLIDDMLETMYAAPGIGLAATQVDVHKRLIVIDVSKDHNEPVVLINPEILAREGEASTEEGCLSVPGIFDEVKRATKVRVRAQDRNGETFERDFEDILAADTPAIWVSSKPARPAVGGDAGRMLSNIIERAAALKSERSTKPAAAARTAAKAASRKPARRRKA